MSATVDALNTGDPRKVAAKLLADGRRPWRERTECMDAASSYAAELSVRALLRASGEGLDDARLYAAAWELLSARAMRLYARRERDRRARLAVAA